MRLAPIARSLARSSEGDIMTTLADITINCSNYAGYDPRSDSDEDRSSWRVGPVGRTRDSDLIAESNWNHVVAMFDKLDPDHEDHEVHRFGHWAVGWVEEIAYRPGSAIARAADEIRARLDGYLILDEHDLSQRECDALDENLPTILSDLRRDLLREFKSRAALAPNEQNASADELEDWLTDDVTDATLWDLARDRGESREGWHYLSKSDIVEIADALLALDGESEVSAE
jgi:hypothetical protein